MAETGLVRACPDQDGLRSSRDGAARRGERAITYNSEAWGVGVELESLAFRLKNDSRVFADEALVEIVNSALIF